MNAYIFPYQASNKSHLSHLEKSVLATDQLLSKKDFIDIKEMLHHFDFSQLKVYCIVSEETVAGFIAIIEAKVEMLFLDTEFIGKGLGYQLMQYAVNEHKIQFVDVNEQKRKCHFLLRKMRL